MVDTQYYNDVIRWHFSDTHRSDGRAAFSSYAESLGRSAFVLCPRGYGPSLIRLFEAMQVGRCPVIISDNWLPPPFVDWSTCSIRVPEASIEDIPAILRKRQGEAGKLGREARRVWEQFLSPSTSSGRSSKRLSWPRPRCPGDFETSALVWWIPRPVSTRVSTSCGEPVSKRDVSHDSREAKLRFPDPHCRSGMNADGHVVDRNRRRVSSAKPPLRCLRYATSAPSSPLIGGCGSAPISPTICDSCFLGDCEICRNRVGNPVFQTQEMMFGTREESCSLECSGCGCLQLRDAPEDFAPHYPPSYYSFREPYSPPLPSRPKLAYRELGASSFSTA